ncbi:MAG: HAD family hydrolase [Actinomycetota bacterium]
MATVSDRFRELYTEFGVPGCDALSGAKDALTAVRNAGGRSIVITAKYEPNAVRCLEYVGLDVDDVVGWRYGPGKASALTEQGASAYVGDTPTDVAAAHAAGAVGVGVPSGPHSAEELDAAGGAGHASSGATGSPGEPSVGGAAATATARDEGAAVDDRYAAPDDRGAAAAAGGSAAVHPTGAAAVETARSPGAARRAGTADVDADLLAGIHGDRGECPATETSGTRAGCAEGLAAAALGPIQVEGRLGHAGRHDPGLRRAGAREDPGLELGAGLLRRRAGDGQHRDRGHREHEQASPHGGPLPRKELSRSV